MKGIERVEVGISEGDCEDFLDHNEVVKAKQLTFQDIRDHMSGPVVSLMVHIILIALLSAVIVIKRPDDDSARIDVDIIVVPVREMVEMPKHHDDAVPEDPTVDMPVNPVKATFDDPDVPPVDSIDVPNLLPDVIFPDLNVIKTNAAKIMPALMSNRSAGNRNSAVIKHGPGGNIGRKGQDALLRGLRWLKDHQNPDGSWGDSKMENVPAYTGLALLAFLGRGETPSSVEFGRTVLKAIKKLKEFTGSGGMGVRGGYRHGIVMYALAEAYAMTRISQLEDVVDKGVARIISGQNAKGSFNYGYDNSKQRCDLSVAGWNYQALKAAFSGGCNAEGLLPAIDKSIDVGLKRTHLVSTGGFTYSDKGGAKGTMTSVGVLCLQLFGDIDSGEVNAGIRYLEQPSQFWFSWKGKNDRVPPWSLYQWYYQTQVFFQAYEGKGRKWRKWNQIFNLELIKRQQKDGRWDSPGYLFGSKEGHGEGAFQGLDQPVYSTSLCCLMLEVYYRYMTTSAARNVKHMASQKKIINDDLGLIMQ